MSVLSESRVRIGVVGARGVVGRELLRLLEQAGVPAERIACFARDPQPGDVVVLGPRSLPLAALSDADWQALDLVFFAAPSEVASRWAPRAVEAGALVVDASSAFRKDERVPLVVPEVNGAELASRPSLVASPNCATSLLTVALEPLRRAFGLERVVVSTYQAVSGAGLEGMRALERDARQLLGLPLVSEEVVGEAAERPGSSFSTEGGAGTVFPEPCAFNVFPHEADEDPRTGHSGEEQKIIDEARRLWGLPHLAVLPTCVRVPVLRAHCLAVTVTCERSASRDEVLERLRGAPGLDLFPSGGERGHPTALKAARRNAVLVGRVRAFPDSGERAARTFSLWIAGDQLRKGAAWNALQLGEALVSKSQDLRPSDRPASRSYRPLAAS